VYVAGASGYDEVMAFDVDRQTMSTHEPRPCRRVLRDVRAGSAGTATHLLAAS
jgi:hypothetical protein